MILFCGPVIGRLQRRYSKWTAIHTINSNLLYGIPSDPQLTLAILREGERRLSPVPPPPRPQHEPSLAPLVLNSDVIDSIGSDQPLGASEHELRQAAAIDHNVLEGAGGVDVETTRNDDSKGPHSIMRFIKGATKIGVKSAITFDKARAKLGHSAAKSRVGVVPQEHDNPSMGPYEFDAHFDGQEGFLHIDTSTPTPLLAFNKASARSLGGAVQDPLLLKPMWTLPVSDIQEIQKHSGYGFKSKLVAGWALDQELHDSLGLVDRSGKSWTVTAIPRRDAVFNRLISIAGQRWEVW